MVKRSGRVWAAVVGMLALAAWCGAVDFSADTISKVGNVNVTGKLYRQGNKVRQETNAGAIKQAVIFLPDRKVVYAINLSQKTYVEMPQRAATKSANSFDAAQLRKYGVLKSVGREKVGGFVCDKILFTPKDKRMGVATYWVSKDLQWPLKISSKIPGGGTVTVETKNIKTGPLSAALFNVPKGFKKQVMPKMAPPQNAPKGMPPKPK